MERVLKELFDPRWSAGLLIAAIACLYVAMPLAVYRFSHQNPYLLELALHSVIACVGIAIGFGLPLLDSRFRPDAWRISIDARILHFFIWGGFLILLGTTLITAEKVPLISALKGATAQELSEQRAAFFKMREGWQQALNYLNAFFTSYIMPMSLLGILLSKSKYRWGIFLFFVLYCELILEKILYLRVALPVLYLVAKGKIFNLFAIPVIVVSCFAMLYVNTYLARGSEPGQGPLMVLLNTFDPSSGYSFKSSVLAAAVPETSIEGGAFFTAHYQPNGAFEQILWRAFAVPVVTAADWLSVFESKYSSQPFLGATSSTISTLFGLERINFEALVHGTQWGGGEESPAGRSNSFFIGEAYVNFGLLGLIIFSLFVGQALRWFHKSRDEAFRGIWILFVLGMLSGGLLGNLLSNGLAVVFFHCLFVRVHAKPSPQVLIRADRCEHTSAAVEDATIDKMQLR